MRTLALSPKKLLLLAAVAAAASLFIVLANHSVARPIAKSAICEQSTYRPNQPIVIAKVDATASTQNGVLRSEYTQALDAVASAASNEGAYLVVDTFGADPTKTKTLCATSSKVSGAAPLFVTARAAELRRALDAVAQRAGRTNAGATGSAIYGAVADAVQKVRELRSTSTTPADIVVITDGDEAADGTHLRLLLESGATNRTIVKRIIGRLPSPDARGISIEMEGIGRAGSGQPISTTGARRMVEIWQRICGQTGARRCGITTDLLTTQNFGR